jgi:hypothetical protein
VPEISNSNFASATNIIISSDHGHIVTDAQKQVIKILTGQEPENEIRESIIHKFLMVRIFSPADFLITAPDGRRMGRDFVAEADVSEIPEAFYSGSQSGEEFAIIPDPLEGEYSVSLSGTGNGEYRLSMSYAAEDNTEVTKDFIGTIALDQQQDFTVDYSASGTLDELQPQDTVPPVISVISPNSRQSYFRDQKLVINYSAIDDFSGIAKTTIAINGKELATSTVNLSAYPVGSYQLSVTATDKAGNTASTTVGFAIITDLPHTIADVELFYQQQKISRDSKNKLLAPLELLRLGLKLSDLAIFLAQKSRDAISSNDKLIPIIKIALLAEADKKLAKLRAARPGLITVQLNNFDKQLNSLLCQSRTNQFIYDILKADSNYLRNNLK